MDTAKSAFATVLETPGYNPWLYSSCGYVARDTEAETYIRHVRDLLAFADVDPNGLDIVDAGCGFGFPMIALAEMGAKSVRGIDLNDSMIHTVQAYLPLLGLPITAELGDVASMPYPDRSEDLILSMEAISHYRDVPGFIREAHRILRPGGVVLIGDSNNAVNPLVRRKTEKVWRDFEQGGSGQKPYLERRREWIAEHFPNLPAKELAVASYGYDFRELQYVLRNGNLRPRRGAPVNPEDGMYLERMWNPFRLAEQFEQAEFSARVRGYWGGASGRRLIRLANRVLSATSLTMPLARGFRLAAKRRSD